AAQGRSPILPKGTWSRGPRGRAATEVVLDKLVDDLQLTLPKADPQLVQELTEKGVSQPVPVTINSAEGVAWADEADLPLLAALRETAEASVPIVLNRSEELSSLGRSREEMGGENRARRNDDGFASVRTTLP